jgi:uncharacterized membrane protein
MEHRLSLYSSEMINTEDNYKWGLFYFNPDDPRVIVPKRIPWMGWTLNFARFYSWFIIFVIIAVAVLVGYLN